VLWSFSGFVLPILTATLFIVALVSSKFVSSAQWSQFAIAWVVAATCVPPLFRVLPGKREERTWSSWQKQGLILQSQRDAILRNRELYNLGQTMFAPRDTFSWNLREKETKGSTKLETIVIDHVHRSVDFVKYDTLTACWFFPGVTMDLYVERTQRQQTAVKLTKTPLSCARAEMFREARIRNADFVLAKHSRCQLSFHKVRS
jgi:hypothetical protein